MKRILILGAGFAGVQTAIELDRVLPRQSAHEILLVNDQNFFLFTPLMPQVVSSYINPRHFIQPIRDIRGRRRFRFRRDTVLSLDLSARRVNCLEGPLDYDYLVLALGSVADYFHVPGARDHTWDFKSLEDAVVLRERLLDLCEHADHTSDPELRRRLLTFVVVGGGYTGVELITEMQDFLFHYVVPRHRGIAPGDIRLVVLEATAEVLRGVHPNLARYSCRRLDAEGIEVRTNSAAVRCFPGGVEVSGGEVIQAETVIWAAGVRAHPLVESLPGAHDRRGRAQVNEHLQLEGHPHLFVAGDSAAALHAVEAPQVAPVAIDHGSLAARNIAHLERGTPLESFRYAPTGMLVSLGMNYAVVSIGGLRFSGYFAWLIWNAVHLFKLVGFKKQLQVALDWMLGSIFPRDASILRRPVRCKICSGGEEESARAAPTTRSAGP